MSDEAIKWRYGFRLRDGRWLWPRGHYEYDLDRAKAVALRTFPFADAVGVEPASIEPEITRWVHERGKGWRLDDPQAEAAARRATMCAAEKPAPHLVDDAPSPPAAIDLRPGAAPDVPTKPWWDRD